MNTKSEPHDWAFEIGQRAKHYSSNQAGTIRQRDIRYDPMDQDDAECYLIEFDTGFSGFYFSRQLENLNEE